MSCPYCNCASCAAERQRWIQPWQPVFPLGPAQPFTPLHPPVPPGYWHCACGQTHPPGYTCAQFVRFGDPDVSNTSVRG